MVISLSFIVDKFCRFDRIYTIKLLLLLYFFNFARAIIIIQIRFFTPSAEIHDENI